jgi:hypothetical protein
MNPDLPGDATITRPGEDKYGRVWRLAPTGVEHMLRDPDYEPRSPWAAMAIIARLSGGAVLTYCGRDVRALPPSPTLGESRPCVRCLMGEAVAE